MLKKLISIFLLSFLVSPLYAASFDCNKATTETEKAICADPELSALDEFVAASYKLSRNGSSDKQKVLTEQRAWIEERDKIWLNFDDKIYYTEKDHLYHFMSKRIGSLLETVIGTNYQTVKNQFSRYTTGVAYFGEHERFMLLSAKTKKPKYQNFHNALFFDKNHKLAKVFIGDTYGRGSACEDSFRIKEKKPSGLIYLSGCGVNNRVGWRETFYLTTQECLNLQYTGNSNGRGSAPRWRLTQNKEKCLEDENFNIRKDWLGSSHTQREYPKSMNGLLLFLTDYWTNLHIEPYGECSSPKNLIGIKLINLYVGLPRDILSDQGVINVPTSNYGFLGYQEPDLTDNKFARLIEGYEKNKEVFDLFMPFAKILNTDGSLEAWVSSILKDYDNDFSQTSNADICKSYDTTFKVTKGDFYNNTMYMWSGFWDRRQADGTADQTVEILRKLLETLRG